MNKPAINVTPLIDVLLVLLIIFMVVAPMKPSSLKARVPAEPKDVEKVLPPPDTLVVAVDSGGRLRLNNEGDLGTSADAARMIERLQAVFAARIVNGNVSGTFADDPQRPMNDRIERTVFIKAPRMLDYGSVARVVDAAKLAGAFPISLHIDNLDN